MAIKGQPERLWWNTVLYLEFSGSYTTIRASLVAQTVKRLPTMRETRVRSLGQEDSPGEGNGTSVSLPET